MLNKLDTPTKVGVSNYISYFIFFTSANFLAM